MVLTGLLEEHGLGREWWKTAAHMTEPRVREGTSMSGGHLTWVTFVAVRCVCVCVFLTGHGDVENLPLLSVCMARSEMTGVQPFTSFFLLVSGDA